MLLAIIKSNNVYDNTYYIPLNTLLVLNEY